MIRRPPRSTRRLTSFPTRRSSDLARHPCDVEPRFRRKHSRRARDRRRKIERSEEHTSETPVTNRHLVCRLLLEKKKNPYKHKRIVNEFQVRLQNKDH